MPRRLRRGTRGRRPRRSLRRRRRSRVGGRGRTRIIRGVWWVDGGCMVGQYLAGQSTGSTPANYAANTSGLLPAFNAVATSYNALVYVFDANLNNLVGSSNGYQQIAQLHDQVRLNRFKMSFKCNSKPNMELTTTIPTTFPTAVDLRNVPQLDPDYTWIDYDGSSIIHTGGAGATSVPANGDVTAFISNYYKARAHRAFGNFRVTLRPRILMGGAVSALTPSAGTVTNFVSNINPWLATYNSQAFFGRIYLALSYKGQDGGANFNPEYNLSFRSGYDVSLRSALWG